MMRLRTSSIASALSEAAARRGDRELAARPEAILEHETFAAEIAEFHQRLDRIEDRRLGFAWDSRHA